MAAVVFDPQARNQPERFAAATGALLGVLAGGPDHFATDPAARQPCAIADWVHHVGAAGDDCAGLYEQYVRRGDGHLVRGRGFRFHLSAGSGKDRASISLLPYRFLQRAFLAGYDVWFPAAIAARLLRGGLGDSSGDDSSLVRHLHGVSAGALDFA